MQWQVGGFPKDTGKFYKALVESYVFCLRMHVPAVYITFICLLLYLQVICSPSEMVSVMIYLMSRFA